ncbi:type II and III secretion system protein family protein [Lampropedia puyangensis]|uniref:Type II and III secretion system protein family protein n=2 Tax=Lampropedia puyangensis TaxID=1330072 RepID=A0A4S8EYK6_9BURK|nr:type II and III secretion system protein family protein [Lampropedia puyangensis]
MALLASASLQAQTPAQDANSSPDISASASSSPILAQAETPSPNESFYGELLQLHSGHQQMLRPGQGIGRIAVGNPDVLEVKVLREKPGSASDVAELLLTAKNPGRTTLVVWPRRAGPPQSWQVQVRAQSLILERKLASIPEHAQAVAALRQSAPPDTPLFDRSQIAVKSNTVQVDVQVVEFKKSALKKAGINIASLGANDHGFNFGLYNPATGSGQSPIADAMNLVMGFGNAFSGAGMSVRLSVLEGNGLARVLAKPTLLAHSGQSASFLAGGELPIPVSANDGNIGIEYKEFGVRLQLTPTVLADSRIALKVAPEASDLDFSNAVSVGGVSVPAIRTRRADTMVELADGESFVIGGLVSRNTSSNVNKVPLLGDLPVLGAFFKNLSYSQEETELVIIVTPRLVNPLPAGTDFEALLPGATSERRNATQVWEPYVAGGLKPDAALPGFSY